MTAKKKNQSHPPSPVIRYAPLGELKVYQVQEHELDLLAAGSPSALYFNFAVFLFPIAVTLVVTLTTTEIHSDRLYQSYVAVSAVTFIASCVLFFLWWKSYRATGNLLTQIKNRMPMPEPIERTVIDIVEITETLAGKVPIGGTAETSTVSDLPDEPPSPKKGNADSL